RSARIVNLRIDVPSQQEPTRTWLTRWGIVTDYVAGVVDPKDGSVGCAWEVDWSGVRAGDPVAQQVAAASAVHVSVIADDLASSVDSRRIIIGTEGNRDISIDIWRRGLRKSDSRQNSAGRGREKRYQHAECTGIDRKAFSEVHCCSPSI